MKFYKLHLMCSSWERTPNLWLIAKTQSNMSEHSWSQVFSQEVFFFFFALTWFSSSSHLLSLVWKCANTKRFLSITCKLPILLRSYTHKPKEKNLLRYLAKFISRSPDSGFTPLTQCILLFQVLTFDGSGVSGHANHIAIYKAVRYWLNSQALIPFYFLF